MQEQEADKPPAHKPHKCDGREPCSNCEAYSAKCLYQPSKFRVNTYNQQQSFKAVQGRLAELEAIVKKHGFEVPEASTTDDSPYSADTPLPHPIVSASDGNADGRNPILMMLRDLSIGALGEYVGASSQVTMSRLITSMARSHDMEAMKQDGSSEGWEHLSPKSASTGSRSRSSLIVVDLASIPSPIADKLFKGYMRHISTRWPVMHTPYLAQLHGSRSSLADVYEITALHLVYAIGGRFLETAGETGEYHSELHFETAIENLDEVIRHHNGLRSVQILTLLALYNLRSPKGPGAWTFVGLAMRRCIDLGLHRQTTTQWPLIDEMRRRVFWTCYCLDRQVSIILGRPFAISDRDIDVAFPTDVDEDVEDLSQIEPQAGSSSMTGFIYTCRLRMIESDIQQTIYRVDTAPTPRIKADVEGFIARLETWKSQIPLDAHDTRWVDGYDNYMVYYYKCMRFLLFPVILDSDIADVSLLQKCAEACAGVCRTYKKLHQKVPVGFSVMALHSIFIAGLTLLYCTWAAPKELFNIGTSNGLNSCSIVLYVIAERWTGARKYRDVFDVIKQEVLEAIDAGGNEPRQTINSLRQRVSSALQSAGSSESEVGKSEFLAIVRDITGEEAGQRVDEALDADFSAMGQDMNFTMPFEAMPSDGLGWDFGNDFSLPFSYQ